MNLYVWPSDFGLPSIDTRCLQFAACAKFCAAPVTVIPSVSAWKSPNGEYPVFTVPDNNSTVSSKITDFSKFTEFLRMTAQDVILDVHLTSSEKSEIDAFAALMQHKFYPAQLHLLWCDKWNYSTVTSRWFASHLSFPYGLYYLESRRKRAAAYVAARKRTETELITDAIGVINLLSLKLGDNKYFYGDKPSSLDALIFGYLAPMVKLPLPSDRLQQHILACPNLIRFVESIISIYLPLSETQIRQQASLKDEWAARRHKAQREAEQAKLRKESVDTKVETPIRDAVIFAVGALTLSILFAVHSGIVQIAVEEDE
ncbi:hypothetical protein AB6A40_004762 [Gnathostoma spinigerum]|uniref:Metaxin n=1 Tax=Gnathostoma spinigerum TaxID=75299 RepID=A0ABD6EDG5_9BILA